KRVFAQYARCGKQRQRKHRTAWLLEFGTRRPNQRFPPDRVLAFAGAEPADHGVELLVFEFLAQSLRQTHADFEAHARISRREARQDLRQLGGNEVLGNAEAYLARDGRLDDPPHRFVVQLENAPRVAEQRLPLWGEGKRAAGTCENPTADDLLEALDLDAHCRLRPRHQLRGRGKGARVRYGSEAAQQVDIEIGGAHGSM